MQITRTIPFRRMMRHCSHRFETDAETFMKPFLSFHGSAWRA
ncbi:MAG: hypothetical protein AVDCRST_MAG43-205 [uncultured Thermomicrobiales bacterium]|uniref:Uncharacterized protein n=1 Tax=uncultured Thermomicrobiales bacterium TaxID=1645740 RepID=A0A6J4U5X8_9BACT|nr:MAG: hypothetical protein AVDCRST_MAG43-205 [uncultured Thermomicrobiales bacterium]